MNAPVPAFIIRVDLEESAPAITVDAVNAGRYRRLTDWVGAHPQLRDTCRLCDASLSAHEKPEAICDLCLRAHQWRPS